MPAASSTSAREYVFLKQIASVLNELTRSNIDMRTRFARQDAVNRSIFTWIGGGQAWRVRLLRLTGASATRSHLISHRDPTHRAQCSPMRSTA